MPGATLAPGDERHWARSIQRGPFHIVDDDSRRTLCGRYSEPLDHTGAPGRDVPAGAISHPVCEDCVAALRGVLAENDDDGDDDE